MSENGTFLLVSLDRSIPEESSKNRCNTSRVQSLELYCYPGFKCRGTNRVCLWLYDERNESVGGLRRPINPQRSNTMAPPDRHRSARPGSGLSLSVLGESTREIFFFFFFFCSFPPISFSSTSRFTPRGYDPLKATFHEGVGPGSQGLFNRDPVNRDRVKRLVRGYNCLKLFHERPGLDRRRCAQQTVTDLIWKRSQVLPLTGNGGL